MSRMERGAVAGPCPCPGDRRQRGAAVRLFVYFARQARRGERSAVWARHANYVENFTPFVAVALALIVTQRTGGSGAVGATIWILARAIYIPVYLLGIMYARTAIWAISIVGLVMMLSRLIGW